MLPLLLHSPKTEIFSQDASAGKMAVCSIEKILDVRPAAALKAGDQGDRYTVQINGHQSYLFFERSPNISGTKLGKWFVERK